jgi:hypothetical protein
VAHTAYGTQPAPHLTDLQNSKAISDERLRQATAVVQ